MNSQSIYTPYKVSVTKYSKRRHCNVFTEYAFDNNDQTVITRYYKDDFKRSDLFFYFHEAEKLKCELYINNFISENNLNLDSHKTHSLITGAVTGKQEINQN